MQAIELQLLRLDKLIIELRIKYRNLNRAYKKVERDIRIFTFACEDLKIKK
jgi:hypothetical protein